MKTLNYINVLGKEYKYTVQEGVYYLEHKSDIIFQMNRDGVISYAGEIIGRMTEEADKNFVYTLNDDTKLTFNGEKLEDANMEFFHYYIDLIMK